MQSVLTLLVVLVPLIGSVYSCYPCKCGKEYSFGIWANLKKMGDCRDASSNIDKIPSTVDTDIDALLFYKQSLSSLQANQFIRFTKLQIFYARSNKITYIHNDAFKNMTNLKIINIGYNNIMGLPRKLFTNTPNISHIWLQANKLKILQSNLFYNLPYLKKIYLEKNMISIVEENCFVNLPSLEFLGLNNNSLKTLQLNLENDLPSLKSLLLSNNIWNCDDTLCDVINTVVGHRLKDNEIPTCTTPANLRGKKWNKLKLQDFTPSIVSSVTSVQEGDDIVLQCKYCFISNITWIMNSTADISRKYHQIHDKSIISTMTLENVQKDEAGKYSCHVENCQNCKDASVYVSVTEKFTTAGEIYDFDRTTEAATEESIFTTDIVENDLVSSAATTCVGSITLLLMSLLLLI